MSDASLEARTEPSSSKKTKSSKAVHLGKLLSFILLIGVVVLGYLYFNTKKELTKLSSMEGQQAVAQQEVKEVTDKLSKLTILPDEEPVVATILDVQLLATQSAFYQNAENGDKLVVYPQAQKAYIYSPSKNVIVNAGPLVADQNQDSRPVRFELRNGSTVAGAATRLKEQLEKDQQLVTAVTDASRQDYQGTLVIPINPAIQASQLQQFAQDLGATVREQLPAGEASSEADILIIVGE